MTMHGCDNPKVYASGPVYVMESDDVENERHARARAVKESQVDAQKAVMPLLKTAQHILNNASQAHKNAMMILLDDECLGIDETEWENLDDILIDIRDMIDEIST